MSTMVALKFPIRTRSGLKIGTFTAESREPVRALGHFAPGADYPTVEHYFAYFAELVED